MPRKPWDAVTEVCPRSIFEPRGMIGPEERRCYYWLGKNYLSRQGCIVDAGAFAGASTFCFAAGAAASNERTFCGGPIVHAYDHFRAVDRYVVEFIRKNFRPIERGDSYLDLFKMQVAEYRDFINYYPGDFLGHRWSGDPIEILFVDIAKTAELNAHVISEFFPSLIPGRSILVHQDYFHCWHPYIHIGMEFFDDEFELIDEHVLFQSRIWRLIKPLPAEKIARMRTYDLSYDERAALLDRVVEKSTAHSRPMMEVVRLWQHCIDKDYVSVKRDLAQLRRAYGVDGRPELWFRQALAVEQRCKGKLAEIPDIAL